MSDSIDLSIAFLSDAYKKQKLSPEKLIDAVLARCDDYQDYNIWITLLSREQITPWLENLKEKSPDNYPLWGIPFAIKDNIDLIGIPTTAACPGFSRIPEKSAFVVQQLIDAGAIPVGKTNLDQFATGLNGTRSPYGPCKNSFNPEMISGGSSSGSAVAVALGLASFSLGTDTAGSGRIPAAFNNIIGVKPSIGLLSCSGVVPACRSLDCVTFFAATPDDANRVFEVAAACDGKDVYARQLGKSGNLVGKNFTIGIPGPDQLEFFGHPEYPQLFRQACEQLQMAGAEPVTIDASPFIESAGLLYGGPWVAERYHAVGAFIERHRDQVDNAVATIVQSGKVPTAVDVFDGMYQLQSCKKTADAILETVDCIVMPTTTNHYSIETMLANPIDFNTRLGYYTNFMNLLDYCALALPAGFTADHLPFGITLFARALEDKKLQVISEKYLSVQNWGMGATGLPMPTIVSSETMTGYIPVAVCGAHLTGMPLNFQLTERGAVFLESATTSPRYEFYALADGPPFRPGLKRVEDGGEAVYVEVWAVPEEQFGSFVAGIPAPLGIGKLELEDGRSVPGFICEPYGLDDAKDISEFKDWRLYIASLG